MDVYYDLERKIKQKRKILFSHESKCLMDLISSIEACDRKTLILWAFDCADSIIEKIGKMNPGPSKSVQEAVFICRKWAEGSIGMQEAKKAILSVHNEAKSTDDKSLIALYHAVGQACSTVHTSAHAPGLIYYELTSEVIDSDYSNYEKRIEDKIGWYSSMLEFWKSESQAESFTWADFLKS